MGAFHATNITITGKGTIDGQGKWWWDGGNAAEEKEISRERPRLVEPQFVDGLTISYIHLTNSPFWYARLTRSLRTIFLATSPPLGVYMHGWFRWTHDLTLPFHMCCADCPNVLTSMLIVSMY